MSVGLTYCRFVRHRGDPRNQPAPGNERRRVPLGVSEFQFLHALPTMRKQQNSEDQRPSRPPTKQLRQFRTPQ